MLRRDFSALLGLSALGTSAGLPLAAQAQTLPVEGQQYKRLDPPLRTAPGKLEVVEFFWYGCPHCYVFDPILNQWLKKLPSDVSFRRVHVAFDAMQRPHQRLFFALEAIGQEAEFHSRVLEAFHTRSGDLFSDEGLLKIMEGLGADMPKLRSAWNSFGVQTRCQGATQLSEDYRIDGVPTLGIAGRYWTSPSAAGTRGMTEAELGVAALRVADYLIAQVRSGH